MKNIIILILIVLMLCSCAKTDTTVLSNGYDAMVFKYNLNVSTEITNDNLVVIISNYNNITYELWITYKYKSNKKKGYSRELLYSGSKFKNVIFAKLPDDNKGIEQSMEIKIKDINGDVMYDSPVIKLK